MHLAYNNHMENLDSCVPEVSSLGPFLSPKLSEGSIDIKLNVSTFVQTNIHKFSGTLLFSYI